MNAPRGFCAAQHTGAYVLDLAAQDCCTGCKMKQFSCPCKGSMRIGNPKAQARIQTVKYNSIFQAECVAVERWDSEGGSGDGGRPQVPDLPTVG